MFNKVILVGNLTRDIEIRYMQNGTAIGNSAIAVNRKFTTNGEKRDETCFIDITFFGRTAEIANQYLKKGNRLLIEGRLKFNQWDDQQTGQRRTKHTIDVEMLEMLGDKNNQNEGGYNQNSGGYSNYQNNQGGYQSYQNSNNYGYSNNSYNQQNNAYNQQNSAYNQPKQKPQNNFEEKIPDIDVDNYDNDENIPF